ncbi:hypothetical protein L579_0090 [Pantoea sp. AS-PWVM4]|nr:hypothetical protein L579_0090 [Pantoea sp. AS-PWVM4]
MVHDTLIDVIASADDSTDKTPNNRDQGPGDSSTHRDTPAGMESPFEQSTLSIPHQDNA